MKKLGILLAAALALCSARGASWAADDHSCCPAQAPELAACCPPAVAPAAPQLSAPAAAPVRLELVVRPQARAFTVAVPSVSASPPFLECAPARAPPVR